MEPVQQTPNNSGNSGIGTTDNGKTIALVSYLTFVGWIVAYVMHSSQKTSLGAFHLRQSLFLFLAGFILYFANLCFFFIPYLGWIITIALSLAGIVIFILWVMGLVAAINGEQKPVPIVGETAQQLFKGLGN